MYKRFALVLVLVFLTASCIIVRLTSADPVPGPFTLYAYIRSDGSIDPSFFPIQRSSTLYTLTSDVLGGITVQRNNMILDGNGHTLSGGGLSLNNVSNVTVENLTVTGNVFGISVSGMLNVITNNTITRTGNSNLALNEATAGIYVTGRGSNIIAENNLAYNYNGMYFTETENNLIIGNNITDSSNPRYPSRSSYGVMFWEASNNTIYHNSFVNNDAQAHNDILNSPFSINTWDNGYPSGGNYWSDYETRYPKAAEIDSSRIGDIPYVIDANNTDHCPLIEPFNNTYYTLETTPPKISVLSPINQAYNESSVSLVFAVDKSVNWTGYSLDGKQDVTITGNTTIANITNGMHNIIVYANDTFGNICASQNITFAIAKSETFPTAPVVAVSGASAAVVVVAGLAVYFKKRKH